MTKLLLLVVTLMVGTFVLLSATTFAPASVQKVAKIEVDEDIPDRGVLTVDLDDYSQYLIDTRFDLCFLRSFINGVAVDVVVVPCEKLKLSGD